MSNNLIEVLMASIQRKHIDKVNKCLKQGIDPNAHLDGSLTTPLHLAVSYGAFNIAKLLLIKGADPLAEDSEGETPLQLARIIVQGKTEDRKRHQMVDLLENHMKIR